MMSTEQENVHKNLSLSCNQFSNEFYKVLSSDTQDNVATSPVSLHVILSLLSNGASGVTLEELQSALHYNDITTLHKEFKSIISTLNDVKDIELHVKNTIFIQNDFEMLPEFLSVSTDVFQCSVSRTDFNSNENAANEINTWVKKATKDKIDNIVTSDDFDQDTKLVLINAVYFKSHWLHQFDVKHTENRVFHITTAESKHVPMMFKKSKYVHGEIPSLHASFIEIPYVNKDIVMIILLPNEIEGLKSLETNFDWKMVATAPRRSREIELYLPRFKIEVTANLENILNKIGLKTMFEDNANFDRLSNVPLKVSKVLQKVFVEVNEEGSEAAAATALKMRMKRMAHLPEQFVVNHPFMFAIEHKPSTIPLFLGSVRNIQTPIQRDEL